MRLPSKLQLAAVAIVCFVASKGIASAESNEGHRSSLKAVLTMADGSTRPVTLEGVGCTASMCSRVRARENSSANIWLDQLASATEIQDADSGVQAVFQYKDGSTRAATIENGNRVLYIANGHGKQEKLDLARVSRIEFQP